jgi:hypothetical protein
MNDSLGTDLTEEELVRGFEDGSLEEFPHASHVRLTLIYLRRHGREGALRRMNDGLRKFVALKGVPEKYHVTLTRAWLDLLDSAVREHPGADEPGTLMQACPELLDKNALLHFYSREVLGSETARMDWTPPDRVPEIDARLLRSEGKIFDSHA